MKPLEEQLNDFFAAVARVARAVGQDRLAREAQKKRWAEEAARRVALEQERQQELARVRGLEDEAAAWRRSLRIRAYIRAVTRAGTRLDGVPHSTLTEWIGRCPLQRT
jgi:hypothetical protein